MSPVDGDKVPLRVQCAVYGVGGFSTTMHFMAVTIVPLWVVGLELSPFLLGIVLGCRPVLPLLLSIHTGALMDRIGGRRVMLFFAALGLLVPLLYPALPFLWAVIALQLLWGLADSMGWLGAQTLIGQLMRGRTVYAGRLAVASRLGNIVGPPVAGAMWDLAGPWAAFGLACVAGLGALGSALMLPAPPQRTTGAEGAAKVPGRPLRAFLPRPSDYVATFRLLAVPTVAITVAIGMMTHVGNNVQATFYVVWLNETGISGTLIGTLFSISSMAASVGPLLAAPLTRYIRAYWLLWFVVWASIVLIAVTPVLGTYLALAAVLSLRNLFTGIHQPLVITLTLRTAGPESQGKAIGLRGTANRVTSVAAPVIMGAVGEVAGLEASFYVIGLGASLLMIVLALWMTRHPEIHENAAEGGARR